MIAYDYTLVGSPSVNLNLMAAITYEAEDLCNTDDERRLRDVIRWLNEQGADYHLTFLKRERYYRNEEMTVEERYKHYIRDYEGEHEHLIDATVVTIYDQGVAALLQIVFDGVGEPVKHNLFWTNAQWGDHLLELERAEAEKKRLADEKRQVRVARYEAKQETVKETIVLGIVPKREEGDPLLSQVSPVETLIKSFGRLFGGKVERRA